MRVVIALGANLGEPRAQLEEAIEAVREIIKIEAISSFYETKPCLFNRTLAQLTGKNCAKQIDTESLTAEEDI